MIRNAPIAALLAAALTAPLAVSAVHADSLYPEQKSRSMFADRRAHAIGDVVLVVLTENTTAVQSADVDLKKTSSAQANGAAGLWGLLKIVPKASYSGSTAQKGSGATTRSSRLTSTIACRVVELTPSGQLIVRGERTLKINDDVQTVRFTGAARPEDVAPDNTLSSNVIADARIEVFGKGPVERHARPGLLSRIVEVLF
jgi:flagellar L-ring protein precursor FlgH